MYNGFYRIRFELSIGSKPECLAAEVTIFAQVKE
jgi:hypothetical protein